MSDLDTQSHTTDNRVFDFVKYVLSEFLSKITVVTSAISDVTNQVKFLTTMSSQVPTRTDLAAKIDQVYDTLSEEINKDLLENLKVQHKDISNILEKISEKISNCERNQEALKLLCDASDKKLDVLIEGFKKSKIIRGILIKVIAGVITGIPILWGLFTWIASISKHTG